jgi:predicted Zn-dependent protease
MQANGFGDKYNYRYQFTWVESKNVNVWCMAGAKVAIYSGILPVTQNEAGRATHLRVHNRLLVSFMLESDSLYS